MTQSFNCRRGDGGGGPENGGWNLVRETDAKVNEEVSPLAGASYSRMTFSNKRHPLHNTKRNSVAFSPQLNYID
jgi:hypothetical protein